MTSDAVCLKCIPMTDWRKKLPMQLSMSRVYIVPPLILLMLPQTLAYNFTAAAVFILASITDYYDGYFARKYNAVSNLGKFIDPVTDKILVTSVLIILLSQGKVDPYLVIILLIRDTFIGGIRSAAAADQIVIAAKASGKWKTGLQMSAIPAIMFSDYHLTSYCCSNLSASDWRSYLILLGWLGYFILWFSVVLSLISGFEYFQIFKRESKSAKGLL